MKIAIQISGEFRLLNLTYELFVNNILKSGHEIDIFIHTWEREETGQGTFKYDERDSTLLMDKGNWADFMIVFNTETGLNLYKPKKHHVDNYDSITILKKYPRNMSMFYSMYVSNLLRKQYEKENNIKYDIVMRYRTDCGIYENPFLISDTIPSKDYLCIPVPKLGVVSLLYNSNDPYNKTHVDLTCDYTMWGTPELMDILTGVFIEWHTNPKPFATSESMIQTHLTNNNILASTSLYKPFVDMYVFDWNGSKRGL